MTRDKIIEMAQEAGLPLAWACSTGIPWAQLERFAALVAAAERAACAKVCEEWAASGAEYSLLDAIRARGAND